MNEEPETTTPTENPRPVARATGYHLFEQDGAGTAWIGPVTTIEATSSRAAVTAHLKNRDQPAGTYVAVPTRSWTPVTVEVETQQKLKFS